MVEVKYKLKINISNNNDKTNNDKTNKVEILKNV